MPGVHTPRRSHFLVKLVVGSAETKRENESAIEKKRTLELTLFPSIGGINVCYHYTLVYFGFVNRLSPYKSRKLSKIVRKNGLALKNV